MAPSPCLAPLRAHVLHLPVVQGATASSPATTTTTVGPLPQAVDRRHPVTRTAASPGRAPGRAHLSVGATTVWAQDGARQATSVAAQVIVVARGATQWHPAARVPVRCRRALALARALVRITRRLDTLVAGAARALLAVEGGATAGTISVTADPDHPRTRMLLYALLVVFLPCLGSSQKVPC